MTYVLTTADIGDRDLDKRTRDAMRWLKEQVHTLDDAKAFVHKVRNDASFWTPFEAMGWCLSLRVLASLLSDVLENRDMPSGRHFIDTRHGNEIWFACL